MNSTPTVDISSPALVSQGQSTNVWRESLETDSGIDINITVVSQEADLTIRHSVSTITAIVDPWRSERGHRDRTITIQVYREAPGRSISRSEALWIARRTLERAERERRERIELEAELGSEWGATS